MENLLPLACIIEDVCKWRIDLTTSLTNDLKRVISLVETRGLSIILIDFPDVCKILDTSLSRGYIDYSTFPHTMVEKKNERYTPTIFKSLFEELFLSSGGMFPEHDVTLIFFLRQLLLLYKKVKIQCPQQNVDKAIVEFLKIEDQMRCPTLDWNSNILYNVENHLDLSFHDGNTDMPLFGERKLPFKLLEAMDFVSRYISSMFPVLDPNIIIPRHGPGAVSDMKTGTDKYHFPSWPDKLSNVFDFESFGVANYDCLSDTFRPSSHESPARLIAVPKTYKTPRLIASEPVTHQFLQQGLMRWFRDNLPNPLLKAINFSSQEKSKDEALLSSIGYDTGTVDLSSASDRLSCWVVERFFRCRPDILIALHSVRTRTLSYKSSDSQGIILLKKYANQGSAVTFPLQTIIYASICCASLLFEEGLSLTPKNARRCFARIRAFGDDLIVPCSLGSTLGHLMTYLGLKINWGKTHLSGHFRESCGMDAYKGDEITPMYLQNLSLKCDFSGLQSWVDSANEAYFKGLWSLSEWMISSIPEKYAKLVPISPRPLSCIYLRTMQNFTYVEGPTRWNKTTQQVYMRGLTAKVKMQKGGRYEHQDLLHYFISVDGESAAPLLKSKKISRERSFGYRTILQVRWVPAHESSVDLY